MRKGRSEGQLANLSSKIEHRFYAVYVDILQVKPSKLFWMTLYFSVVGSSFLANIFGIFLSFVMFSETLFRCLSIFQEALASLRAVRVAARPASPARAATSPARRASTA